MVINVLCHATQPQKHVKTNPDALVAADIDTDVKTSTRPTNSAYRLTPTALALPVSSRSKDQYQTRAQTQRHVKGSIHEPHQRSLAGRKTAQIEYP